jgi:multidrug efflux system membrane fusion protein
MEETSPTPPARPDNQSSQPEAHHSVTKKVVVWIVVLLIAAGLFYVVLRSQSTPQAGAQKRAAAVGAVSVTAATAQKGDIGVYLEAIGTVTPVYTSMVTSQVTGLVTAVRYREGQVVRKGTPLIEIDPRPFQAQLEQAQGTLEKDTHVLAQASMDLDRYKAAWARNAVAKQILDDQEKLVLQDQGVVKADQGLVAYDKVQVAYCHITAPFTGRAGLRLLDPGNVVQANSTTPLVVLTQEQPITVIFTIAEDSMGTVQAELRQGAKLTVDAYDRTAQKKIAGGKLLTLDNQIDTTTGTVKLRASFDNKDGVLFPNQFVNTRLLVKTLKDQILVPTSAIQHNGAVAFVYVLQNGTALMKTVTTGAADGGLTAVVGIQPGDVVANSSFEKLQPNAKVTISQPNQPSGQGGSK